MNKIPEWIVCPNTKQKLQVNENTLTTDKVTYPLIGGIPWLFKNPEFYFLEWSTKIELYLKQEESYLAHLQSKINQRENTLTKKRLSKIHEAKLKNLKVMKKTLVAFQGHQPIVLENSTQQIYSYFQLLFRDWVWQKEEVKAYEEFVCNNIDQKDKKILILGAGACGLSYFLANKFPDKEIVSLDHNPFLLLIAQKIFNGEEIKLSDFSYYAKSIDLVTQNHKIKFPKVESKNHQFVLSSFPDIPFAPHTFDMIIAPWFFDILDTPFTESIKHTLNYLSEDGTFLLYGPSNVHKPSIEDQLTVEEIKEEISPLFESLTVSLKELSYLESPLDSQLRKENIQFIAAKKLLQKNDQFPAPRIDQTFRYSPGFEQYKAINSTFYNILKHIDGDISAEELAPKIQKEFNFTQEESIYYAKNVLAKLSIEVK